MNDESYTTAPITPSDDNQVFVLANVEGRMFSGGVEIYQGMTIGEIKRSKRRAIMRRSLRWLFLGVVLGFLALAMVGCGDPPTAPAVLVTVHVYTNNDGGSVVWCPEELDPPPTTWTYTGTAEVDEDHEDVLSQCELE